MNFSLDLPDLFGFDLFLETGEIRPQVEDAFDRQRRNFLRRTEGQKSVAGLPQLRGFRDCGRSLGGDSDGPEIWTSLEGRTAHFGKVATCGNPWLCGVCAPKIAVRRGSELADALIASTNLGIGVALATFTVRHASHETFEEVFGRLRLLFSRVSSGKRAQIVRANFEIVGTVRAIEVTRGLSGWHPHVHQLVFFHGQQNLLALRAALAEVWRAASLRAFSDALGENAVDLRDGGAAAHYVAKWGLENELAAGSLKSALNGGRTAMQLLDGPHDQNLSNRIAFREFANAVVRPGEKRALTFRQLVWSRGLAAKLGVKVEATDEQLAAAPLSPAKLLGRLSAHQWRVLRAAGLDAAPNVLRVAATQGWNGVEKFIELLETDPETARAAGPTSQFFRAQKGNQNV